MMKCDNGTGQAIFDLNEIIIEVQNGSTGAVHWYADINLSNEIFSPYTSSSTTIYAAILDGDCLSEPVAISLIVLPLPEVVSTSIEECETSPNSNIAHLFSTLLETITEIKQEHFPCKHCLHSSNLTVTLTAWHLLLFARYLAVP